MEYEARRERAKESAPIIDLSRERAVRAMRKSGVRLSGDLELLDYKLAECGIWWMNSPFRRPVPHTHSWWVQ